MKKNQYWDLVFMKYKNTQEDERLPMPLAHDEVLTNANVLEAKHIPRILAFDGGGVRGISSLLIVQKLLQEIQRLNGDSQTSLPCEYFDLICGTGTGGLVAIMLGRLRMVYSSFERYSNVTVSW